MELTDIKLPRTHRKKKSLGGMIAKGAFKAVFRLLVSNPPALIIVLVVIFGLIAYTIYSIDYQLSAIMAQYQALSAKPNDSKAEFDKRLFFVSTDADGNKTITYGYRSEEEMEEAQKALEEAGANAGAGTGSGSYGTHVTISGDGEKLVSILLRADYELNEHFKPNVQQYGFVYDSILDAGYPPEFALGIIANITSEGTAGMVQGTYQSVTRDQLVSIANRATANHSNSTGIGLMQWTYYTYMPDLLSRYDNGGVFSADGTIDVDKALKVETAWILERCSGAYRTAQGLGCVTAEQYAEAWCDFEERSSGWCGSDLPRMRFVNGGSGWGSSCEFRVGRATKLANGMGE